MDALKIQRATLAGFDWGARTANIVAALWPERCKAMVSVSGYLIGNQAANKALPDAVAYGILSVDSKHISTAHCNRLTSAFDYYTESWDNFNSSYTGFYSYPYTLNDYRRSPISPTFLIEAYYEGEGNNTLGGITTTALMCRQESYWAVLSGAMGHLFGNGAIWQFGSGWQSAQPSCEKMAPPAQE
jgi:pimeloyl-ACP methyl ester carboxylesterase